MGMTAKRAFIASFSCIALLVSCELFVRPPEGEDLAGPGVMTVTYGDYAYSIGGRDETGAPSRTVKVASIGSGGAVGAWSETASLPEGRAHGAAFAAGNMIYVLGGIGPGGIAKDIYFTSIRDDGSLGFGADRRWEKNLRPLPEPMAAPSSLYVDGRIVLAGGEGADGPLDGIMHARLYQDGQIGQWYRSPALLPEAMLYPLIALREGRFYCGGGAPVSWSAGSHFLLGDLRAEPAVAEGFFEPEEVAAPVLMPGSGFVPPRTTPIVVSGPGTTVRYRKDGGNVSAVDPVWVPGYSLTSAEHFDFRAFDDKGGMSSQVSVDYTPRSIGFLVFIQSMIPAVSDPEARTLCRMDQAVSWFGFSGDESQLYRFLVEDAASSPENPENTGIVSVNLFETDFYTPVLDEDGLPFLDIEGGAPARVFTAGRGKYYLQATETANQAGKAFSAAFLKL